MAQLMGMKAICNYVKRSDATVLQWIREQDFPANKIGGIWESTTKQVDDWKDKVVAGKLLLNGKIRKKRIRKRRKNAADNSCQPKKSA